jgi:hypothetical protein
MTETDTLFGSASAHFSPCRTWRYTLERAVAADGGTVMFVGLNPSTADERTDDATIRRCVRFARDWGFGELVMCNLFAYRATHPRDLLRAPDPIGPDNDAWLSGRAASADLVVAAWGAHGTFLNRDQQVLDSGVLGSFAVLGLTNGGHPLHPVRLRADCRPLNPLTRKAV